MIYIVSGLPRSGTSMMMKMLSEGGMPVLVDKDNPSTDNNPGGAFAYEKTKTMWKDASWIKEAEDKAVKIISYYVKLLPPEYKYKIIFMERDIDETFASHQKMKMPFSKSELLMDAKVKKDWLSKQTNIETLFVNYNALTTDPLKTCEEITEFLGVPLDCSKMSDVFNSKLYRNRKS
jgi:hypothetical protein